MGVFHRANLHAAAGSMLVNEWACMKKLIHISVAAALGLASISAAFSETMQTASVSASKVPASVSAGKDTVGMDTLVQSLQGAGVVKVAFSPASRTRAGESSAGNLGESAASDDMGQGNGGMLVAGLVLVGVIAMRRISG